MFSAVKLSTLDALFFCFYVFAYLKGANLEKVGSGRSLAEGAFLDICRFGHIPVVGKPGV